MELKKNIIYSFILLNLISIIRADIQVVAHGWEVFERNTDSRISSLAQSSIAYPIQTSGSVLLNPSLSINYSNKIGFTHQSKIGGTANSEFIGFDKYISDSTWMSLIILYEGVSGIPETRGRLLDWGLDGIFGTFDAGEGNGSLDEGERLDVANIKFFSQNIFGFYGAYSRYMHNWRIGFGMKLLLHTIDNRYGFGAGLNIGAFKSFGNTNVGAVVNNFPSSGLIWENGTIEISLPSLSIGAHHRIILNKYNLELNPVFKLNTSSSDRSIDSKLLFDRIPIDLVFGIETVYKNNLFFRLGLFQRGTFSSGIGLLWKNISIDYAFLNDSSFTGIEKNHLLSINVSIEWLKKQFKNKI
tara:strand:- start:852 stop:1919 length:1068 start_codon:yes stop_codon:yes gene_type:complete